MQWECAECGAAEGQLLDGGTRVAIDAACHHCGKPLCQKHRIVIDDPALAPTLTSARAVYHCAACKKQFHG